MRILNRFWAIFVIAFKRILSQPGMAVATVLGMIFAISLTMSVPLYTSSVYNRIFLQRVGYIADDQSDQSSQQFPPFTFLFTYDSNILGNLQWEDLNKVNNFFETQTSGMLGLPVKSYERYFATNPLALFPANVQSFPDNQKPLLWSSFAFIDGLKEHVNVVEGKFPETTTDNPIQVMVNFDLATELGLQVGEDYMLFARDQVINGSRTTVSIPVRISGVYQAKDPKDDYWFIKPEMLKERMMVPAETFSTRISPLLTDEIYGAFWYLGIDGSAVRPDQAMSLIYRIVNFSKLADQQLPKIKLAISPVDSLISYQRAANLLTVLLFAFSVPIFGLLLAFITMTASMTVERQRNEIAILRSRGAMMAQMIGIATVESVLLGAAAMAIALPASAWIAIAIGRTRSFLDFSAQSGVDLNWNPTTFYFGLGAIGLTMLARLLPTFQAARDNIVVYKRERARNLRAPLWQRMWLDVMLLIPAAYGLYQLRQSGSIDVLGASAKGDPFTNPLLIMVPALAIFASSLIFLRLMPFLMRVVTWIFSRTKSVGMMMAARHLARTPGTYTLPLVLLILTLSLSAFTATLAGTLDHHLHDQMYYHIGSDANFLDLGDSPDSGSSSMGGAPSTQSSSNGLAVEDPNPPGWYFLPVTEYLKLPGVTDATRVGKYQATALFGSQWETGTILGVDRYNLPAIAFWRPDFSRYSLGDLMNRLAALPDGLLVSDTFMAQHALNQDDLITLRIVNYNAAKEVDFHIAGTFHLFPTYYPTDTEGAYKPLFVANLDYIFQGVGAQYPYDVWLKTDGNTSIDTMEKASYSGIGARTLGWAEPLTLIRREQTRPERQGLFGVLSVGFAAAALLTVLGFLMYALLSYQRRFVELGVLRAIGLSASQMTIFLAAELAFLILMGGLIGTALGIYISNNFIPYLQVGASAESQIPPYVVFIAWDAIWRVYALFGLLFIVALGTLVVLLRRMKIFQAIKMGESV
jgi:putative ABC transport system permease protein